MSCVRGPTRTRRKYSWSRCVCVRTHTPEDYCRGWAVAACVLYVIRADFKRPNVFRELKLLTGVGVVPPRNCGTLAALMHTFPSLPRIIPAFVAREHRSTTCGLLLSTYGRPCVNAIRHTRHVHTFFPRTWLRIVVLPIFPLTGLFIKIRIRLILINFTQELFLKIFFKIDFSTMKI